MELGGEEEDGKGAKKELLWRNHDDFYYYMKKSDKDQTKTHRSTSISIRQLGFRANFVKSVRFFKLAFGRFNKNIEVNWFQFGLYPYKNP